MHTQILLSMTSTLQTIATIEKNLNERLIYVTLH